MNHNFHRSSHQPSHHQRHSPPPPPPPSHYLLSYRPYPHLHHHLPAANFVNSPSPLYTHDDFPQFDRHRFDFHEPRVSPILNRQVVFSDCLLSPTPPLPLPPPPLPRFVDCVDRFRDEFLSPRFIEEFDVDRGFRFGYVEEERRDFNVVDRDELRGVRVYDDRRGVDELRRNVVYGNLRSMNDFEREDLLGHRIDQRGRIIEDLNRRELFRDQNRVAMDELVSDRLRDDQMIMNSGLYHREVFRESELISGGADFVFGEVIDKGRPYSDENVPLNLVRHGSFDVRCDDVSRHPMEFRGREFDAQVRFPGFYEEEINLGLSTDRGRREKVRVKEDLKYSLRKKSAFCRLQPPVVQHTSTSRNRLDKTTPSPHKGKGINVKGLGHRSSSEKKVRSSVDLDVSFKSNALVAKPIIGTTSSSGVEGSKIVRVSDLNSRIDSESPVKARRSRNHGNNPSVPKNEEKQPNNLVKSSPILMKVGIHKIAKVPDNGFSKSSSSGSSSLSGGCNTSSTDNLDGGKLLRMGDKRAGLCEASLPSERRKRKGFNLISRLSSSVVTTAATGVVDVDDSFNSPSGGSLKRGCVQEEPQSSNLNDALPKSIEKRTSDVNVEKGPVEPMVVSVGDNLDKIDICYGRIDSHDSWAATSSVTHDGDASIMAESRVYSTRSDGNEYEHRGLLPGCDIIGQNCSDVRMDDGNEAEMRHSGDGVPLVYSPSTDVLNGDFDSTNCIKLTTISDIEVTNSIQEQHCTSQGSILVDGEARKRRKLSRNACGSMGGNLGHLSLSIKKDVFSLDMKKKVGIEDCNVDPKYYSCNCSKRRKGFPLDPVFIDTFVTDSCDLCASSNALKSMATGSLHSEQPTGELEFSNSEPPPDNLVGEATTSLTTPITTLDSSSKAEVQHTNSQVKEITQVSCMAESGCNRKDGDVLMGSDRDLENAKNCQQRTVHCIQPNHTVYLDGVPLITDMDYRSNINVEVNVAASPSGPFLCTEPTDEIVTSKPDVLTNPLGVFFHGASTFDMSSPAIHTTYNNIIFGEDKKSVSSKCLEALMSQSNLVHGEFQKNVKPTNSAAPSNQPFTQKAATVLSKHSKNVPPIPSSMGSRFSWRNELIHGKTPISSSQASPITTYSKKRLVSSPAKPRTWNRSDSLAASDTNVKMPSSSMAPPRRPPFGKFLKVQDTSYIRKGNSLVRNPASSTPPLCPHGLLASVNQEKPIDMKKNGNIKGSRTTNSSETPDCMVIGGHALQEMPKVNPLSCTEKSSDCNIASMRDYTSPLQVELFDGMDNRVALYSTETAFSLSRNSEKFLDGSLEDAGNISDEDLKASRVKSVVYIKRKANQLIAASTPPELCGHNTDKVLSLSSDNSYYKRRKNQLIRASSESNIQKMVSATDDSSYSRRQRAVGAYSGRSASKGPSKRGVKSLKASLVWKLGDAKSTDKGFEPSRSREFLSHLLPWKRTAFRRSVWQATSASSNFSTSIKTSRKLLSSKNHTLVYKRSGRGFSLRRSKVISLAGSLKWSKSMEKRSKKVEEEAILAVDASDSTSRQSIGASGVNSESLIRKFSSHKSAHVLKLHPGERIFRVGVFKYRMDPSRRTLQRIPDEEAPDSTTSRTEKYARIPYMPKRLLIGSNEYVRIGNGNQLVRDPKRRTRILASEKVRWSLHTARLRLAKKRKFCQFFTRFGRCNKSEGKCPYVHDCSKINVCTKFLKGLCIDSNCKLTHKVIPDRMPDCSFFLQGFCSHESCPYRHVNVNQNATICESFLRGYCAEGNECQKKHSYLCPEFEATGSCPQGSNCKLYHPKKGMSKKGKILEDQGNVRGRYFDPGLTAAVTEPENDTAILEKAVAPKNSDIGSGGDLSDYISLDVSDDELGESIFTNCEVPCSSRGVLGDIIDLVVEAGENKYPNREVVYLSEFDVLNSLPGDVDE